MSILDVIEKVANTQLINANLKYCLVDTSKHPFRIDGLPARPNNVDDFVEFTELLESEKLTNFAGIGISIQASDVCAIDVDHCFERANDITSADDRAKYCLDLFKNIGYCEFSFSGTGLRILFKHPIIEDYSSKYYIKNEKYKVEYYQPSKSFRYVTITGNVIYDNNIESSDDFDDTLYEFLNKYMERQFVSHSVYTNETEDRTYEELMQLVKRHYRKNMVFQNLWFTNAPGSGKDESERDYHLVAYLFENITQDRDLIKQIFETSEFFKTKDSHHIYKWNNQNFRYFNYLYDTIRRTR